MKKLIIVIIILCSVLHNKEIASEKIVLSTSIGPCVKCIVLPDKIISDALEKTVKTYEVWAYVRCRRNRELKVFESNFYWNYKIARDTIGLSSHSEKYNLFILDNKDSILKKINTFSSDFKTDSLVAYLNKL
ncbi:hypothetical protein OAQ99_01035 [Candidatus Kapabacteria bacterium]|nr:hypothetical protein [Candidatus Kapabacteria bacterium]